MIWFGRKNLSNFSSPCSSHSQACSKFHLRSDCYCSHSSCPVFEQRKLWNSSYRNFLSAASWPIRSAQGNCHAGFPVVVVWKSMSCSGQNPRSSSAAQYLCLVCGTRCAPSPDAAWTYCGYLLNLWVQSSRFFHSRPAWYWGAKARS